MEVNRAYNGAAMQQDLQHLQRGSALLQAQYPLLEYAFRTGQACHWEPGSFADSQVQPFPRLEGYLIIKDLKIDGTQNDCSKSIKKLKELPAGVIIRGRLTLENLSKLRCCEVTGETRIDNSANSGIKRFELTEAKLDVNNCHKLVMVRTSNTNVRLTNIGEHGSLLSATRPKVLSVDFSANGKAASLYAGQAHMRELKASGAFLGNVTVRSCQKLERVELDSFRIHSLLADSSPSSGYGTATPTGDASQHPTTPEQRDEIAEANRHWQSVQRCRAAQRVAQSSAASMEAAKDLPKDTTVKLTAVDALQEIVSRDDTLDTLRINDQPNLASLQINSSILKEVSISNAPKLERFQAANPIYTYNLQCSQLPKLTSLELGGITLKAVFNKVGLVNLPNALWCPSGTLKFHNCGALGFLPQQGLVKRLEISSTPKLELAHLTLAIKTMPALGLTQQQRSELAIELYNEQKAQHQGRPYRPQHLQAINVPTNQPITMNFDAKFSRTNLLIGLKAYRKRQFMNAAKDMQREWTQNHESQQDMTNGPGQQGVLSQQENEISAERAIERSSIANQCHRARPPSVIASTNPMPVERYRTDGGQISRVYSSSQQRRPHSAANGDLPRAPNRARRGPPGSSRDGGVNLTPAQANHSNTLSRWTFEGGRSPLDRIAAQPPAAPISEGAEFRDETNASSFATFNTPSTMPLTKSNTT